MTHILQELSFYLSYPFVRYALIVGVLITWGNISTETFFFYRRWSFSCCLWCNGGCYNF